ncbi:MAG: SDR family oxidoreductase [Sulfuricurvum sp.]
MRIVLTGANGYIGRRLKHHLLRNKEHTLRLMVRNPNSLSPWVIGECEVVQADVMRPQTLDAALAGVDIAYYLIHGLAHSNFKELDRQSAQNFLEGCIRQKVSTIIYLGGLGDKTTGSEHLLSRIETGEILSSRPDKVRCLWFRAGVIIGSGSASFEIMRHLIQKLPVMITPKWVTTHITPIGVEDVLRYLVEGLTLDLSHNTIIDIGEEVMSYGELMERVSVAMGLKRYFIPVNFFSPKFSSYWLVLFTPVPFSIARSLIEGLKSDATIQNNLRHTLFSFPLHSLEAAVHTAEAEIETNQVLSRWSDSGGIEGEVDHDHDLSNALFIDRRSIPLHEASPAQVYRTFCAIGGDNGWFGYDGLWKLRGLIDKLFHGVGINRGRRDGAEVRIGDSVDFWKVVDVVENERLLLFAQMKLPGKAWLEFKLHEGHLIQSAYFYPYGVLGRLYWYALVPLHALIFTTMAKTIVARALAHDA